MLAFSPGDLLADRFEILRPLGAGGLAEVFAARDRVAGAEVALKALHAHLSGDASLCERFRRELAVTRSLSHPGIVRVFDLYQHGERPFFTMELLRGRTLAERIDEGPLPRAEAGEIARQIALGLQAAHRLGVVHRDLKPLNVFLLEDPAGPPPPAPAGSPAAKPRVKLLDFGLARVAGAARLTAQSTVLGTPAYLAPEILSGRGCDARADLYALGAVLFEMLTGERAFNAGDPFEVIRRKGEQPPSPKARMAGTKIVISDADDLLIRRALEPDPERRHLDAGQILSALDGKAAPAPLPPPPALTSGELDVVLHHGILGDKRALEDVLEAVGSPAGRGWRARLKLAGEAVLVSKASRETAEAVAALCQERGLAVALQPAQERSPRREALARRAGALGGATGVAVTGAIGALMVKGLAVGTTSAVLSTAAVLALHGPFVAAIAGGYGLMIGLVGWTFAGLGEAPPLRALPAGDPAVRRLMEGITLRVVRLRARADELPGVQQVLYGPLLETAGRLQAAALNLADPAAALPDPLALSAEGVPMAPGTAAARDATVARLLEIAAALDEALATLDPKSAIGPAQEQALERLRGEIKFAEQALPRIERARRGEETPLPG